MDYAEKTVNKNYIYKGRILNLRCDDALLPDGRPCKREIIEHSGGACVLYVENGSVLLVRQYRYAYGESIYEIPAGKLEKGEDPMLAAARELEEETGIKAERLELLFVDYPTPGYTDEKIYIYRAYEGVKTETNLDDGEFLDAEFVPLTKIKEMLKKGEIKDGKTIIALQAYFLAETGF
ncbi:MAG: NUDIX hydrolase [Clostridia bacterium]|jgi:ADP-ribose pyrophosphatase|nr:NUDIX hydrolase [Clostridia bacterium]